MIHVSYGLHDRDERYSKFCGTSILSIFENTREQITVHILHDGSLTADNRDKFLQLAKRYRQRITFYNVEELDGEGLNRIDRIRRAATHSKFHLSAMYRLLLPKLISPSVRKMIYLDAGDTLVDLDIKKLWEHDVREYPLAAVPESSFNEGIMDFILLCINGAVGRLDYFNSGVVILNLEYLRKNMDLIWGTANGERPTGLDFLLEHPELFRYPDQDLLNYCFSNHYLKLQNKFNCIVGYDKVFGSKKPIGEKIYHFAGIKQSLDTADPFNRLYLEYFTKTPWFNLNIFTNINNSLNALVDMQKVFTITLLQLLAQRRRMFLVEPRYLDDISAAFNVRKDEIVFDMSDPDTLQRIVETMHASPDQNLLFVFVDRYSDLRRALRAQRLIENQDFINVKNFLTSKHGVPIDSQPIFNAM